MDVKIFENNYDKLKKGKKVIKQLKCMSQFINIVLSSGLNFKNVNNMRKNEPNKRKFFNKV